MTKNRTSKAVENFIGLSVRPFSKDLVVPFNLDEVISILEKYKAMEKALNYIASPEAKGFEMFKKDNSKHLAQKALLYDPLNTNGT